MSISQLRSMLADDQWKAFEDSLRSTHNSLSGIKSSLSYDQQHEVYELWYALEYLGDRVDEIDNPDDYDFIDDDTDDDDDDDCGNDE